MTDFEILEEKIKESGLTKTYIANKLGISFSGLWNKLNGFRKFTQEDIVGLKNVLNLTVEDVNAIFLNDNEENEKG